LPLYDYDCAACGRRFEVIHGVHADPPASCPLCGSGTVKKAISAPTVHYKGSGWAKRDRRTAVKSGSTQASGDESASDGGSSTSEKDSSAGSESSSDGGEASVPAATGAGDSSSGPPKPSKPGASTKSPAKTSD
jgi:putative FmdB family regulatory protein